MMRTTLRLGSLRAQINRFRMPSRLKTQICSVSSKRQVRSPPSNKLS